MANNPPENIWDEFTKTSKIKPSMESLIVEFFYFFAKEWLARNLSLTGDISEVLFKFTKFPVAIVSGGGSKAALQPLNN